MQSPEMKKLLSQPYLNAKDMKLLIGKYQRARKPERKQAFREEIILNNVRLIRKMVCRHPKVNSQNIEDVFNTCVIHFYVGLEKFDLKRGVNLSTYITFWIKRGIQQSFLNENVIHVF